MPPLGLIAAKAKGSETVANGGLEWTIDRTFSLVFSLSI